MNLKKVEEPKEIKQKLIEKAKDPEWKFLTEEKTINLFLFASGKEKNLASYLWAHWKAELTKEGIKVQDLQRILGRMCGREIINWVKGKLDWTKLIEHIEKKIEEYRRIPKVSKG